MRTEDASESPSEPAHGPGGGTALAEEDGGALVLLLLGGGGGVAGAADGLPGRAIELVFAAVEAVRGDDLRIALGLALRDLVEDLAFLGRDRRDVRRQDERRGGGGVGGRA